MKTDLFNDTATNINSHSGSTYASTSAMLLEDFPDVEAVFVKGLSYFKFNYEHITAMWSVGIYTHVPDT